MSTIAKRKDQILKSDKNQVLEPITTIAHLITLAFKPDNTKISIRDHNVVLCEPNFDYIYGIKIPQYVDRYWNGDSREDIYILNPVIHNFIIWYIIPNKDKDTEIYNGLINLAKYLRVGLGKLQDTYKTGTAATTLQYFINVLTDVIDDKFYPSRLYTSSPLKRQNQKGHDYSELIHDDSMLYSTILNVNKIKQFWTRDQLIDLCRQFDSCFRDPDEPDSVVFRDIDHIDTTEIPTDIEPESKDIIGTDDINTISKDDLKNMTFTELIDTKTKKDTYTDDDIETHTGLVPLVSELSIPSTTSSVPIIPVIPIEPITPTITTPQSPKQAKPVLTKPSPTKLKEQKHLFVSSTRSTGGSCVPGAGGKIHRGHGLSKTSSKIQITDSSSQDLWPVPKSQTNLIVKSNLGAISDVLKMMDKKFTSMLSQSVKGIN
jgi:hypothetical protein